ncbi:MAG: substrate-binding domain-containing protein [Myxococcota bacterium]
MASVRNLSLVALLLAGVPSTAQEVPDRSLLLATTTSVRDSGLLGALLPAFEAESGIRVRVVAVGSGAALRMGADGNADVLLTHAPAGERELVASGAVVARRPFMENHFLIVGPPEDPAGVAGASGAPEALRRIAAGSAPWVSRGDDSGTHRRERQLLAAAGLEQDARWEGFASTGGGMGLTLQVAGERRAYTLTDLGTFLAFADRVGLVPLSREEESLRNPYSILRLDPAHFPGMAIRSEEGLAFERFLLSPATRERIAGFGDSRHGRPLFVPLPRRGKEPETPQP